MATDIHAEAEELIRKAQAQPGIAELMRAYGRYDEMMEQTRMYIKRNKPGFHLRSDDARRFDTWRILPSRSIIVGRR
jgi:hypothetical protein